MSDSSFLVYYGLRWVVTDPIELAALERGDDPRIVSARHHGLSCIWGMASEKSHYLLLGSEIGRFGSKAIEARVVDDGQLRRVREGTIANLKAAGLKEPPALLCQFQPDPAELANMP
jgi:hypothetical protein